MKIAVNVTLEQADHFGMSSEEAAQAVLDALNGDKDKDTCTVQVTMPPGVVQPPPPPEAT